MSESRINPSTTKIFDEHITQLHNELKKKIPVQHGNSNSSSLHDSNQKTVYRKRGLSDPLLGHKHSGIGVNGAKLSKVVIHNSTNTVEVRHLTNDEHDELAKKSPNILRSLQKSQSGFEQMRNEIESSPHGKVQQLSNGRSSAAISVNHANSLDQPATPEEIDTRRIDSDSNWKELSFGYQTMRKAIAEDLKKLPSEVWSGKEASMTDDDFNKKADEVILKAGVATKGLTNASIDRIRECLLTTPEYNMEGKPGQLSEFPMTRALYHAVKANDSINVNTARLTESAADMEDQLAQVEKNGSKKAAAIELLRNLINGSKKLAADVRENKEAILEEMNRDIGQADNDMGDKPRFARARHIASELIAFAKSMYATAFSKDIFPQAAEDGSKIGAPSRENKQLAQALCNAANINRSIAGSLAPPEDHAGLDEIISETLPADDDVNVLMEDRIFNALASGGDMEIGLQSADIIYQDPNFPAREAESGHGDPVNAYNADIVKLRAAYNDYLANPEKQTLEALRGTIDNALASSHHLRANMAKSGSLQNSVSGSPLKSDVNEVSDSFLEMQARRLEQLSTATVIESARMKKEPAGAPDSVLSGGVPDIEDEDEHLVAPPADDAHAKRPLSAQRANGANVMKGVSANNGNDELFEEQFDREMASSHNANGPALPLDSNDADGSENSGIEDDGDPLGILDSHMPDPDVIALQQSANAGYEIDSHIEELENFMQRLTESLDQLSALETKYLKGDQLRMGPRSELHNTSKQIGDTAKALIKACNQRRSEGYGQRNSPKGLNETALKKYENDANSAMKQVSEIEKSIFAYPMSEQERAELQEQISRGARGVSYADVVDDD